MEEINIDETGPDFLLEKLEHYLESAEFADVVLVSQEGDHLPAHRAVLSSASRFLNHVFVTSAADGTGDEAGPGGGLQIQFPHTSTRDLYAFLQLAYCGSMEIGSAAGRDDSRKSALIGVLQMLQVTDDVVVVGNDTDEDDIRVNDINLPGGGAGQNLLDSIAAAEDDEGIPNVIEVGGASAPATVAPIPKPGAKGTLSLLPANSAKMRPSKASLTSRPAPSVTVEFKAKKRPAPSLPPAAVPKVSVVPAMASIRPSATIAAAAGPPLAKMPALLLPQQPLPPVVLQRTPVVLPPIVPNQSTIGMKGMITDRLEADRMTRQMLDMATADHGMNRRCERCQCPNCQAGEADKITGPFGPGLDHVKNLHVCHYADCGKKYKKTSHLRAHLRWHIGDQPFHCSWEGCGRKFTRSDELHRHFRIHTGEKNHVCEVCQKAFSRSDHLKKHLMAHVTAGHVIPSMNEGMAAGLTPN